MHRLFVAIEPPLAVRDYLLEIMGGVANARWQDERQLHLTLRFIGEVDHHQARDISSALAGVRQAPFQVALAGAGSFVRRGKGTLWVGVKPLDPLRSLHKKIDQACLRAGVAPDTRAYHAHVTLARIGRTTGPVEPFIARWAGLSGAPFEVDDFCLYESVLGSEGAAYTIVERYPLR